LGTNAHIIKGKILGDDCPPAVSAELNGIY